MLLIAWVALGVVAAFAASRFLNGSGERLWLDLGLGASGAIIGGFLFHTFGDARGALYAWYGIAFPAVGAMVVLLIHHRLPREVASAAV